MALVSCDTFVVLPPLTAHGGIIFGKNSDRPKGEVQELIYQKPESYPAGSKVMCTYIEIEQAEATQGVILSKPAWMWGAEMGANEAGVVIGNEAVYTKLQSSKDAEEKLLGMDLVRLGLERAKSADEAVTIITTLLEKHGQGGPCSDTDPDFTYHNSFLIADAKEAWVLETAGHLWAAEKIKEGYRNISNCLSLTTRFDRSSADLKEYAKGNNLWNGEDEFNFKKIFANPETSCDRFEKGSELLGNLTKSNQFKTKDMFTVLRDKDSGICRSTDNPFPTTGSQVSLLSVAGSQKPHVHWFTATPDPSVSVFKPFIFTPNVQISQHTVSPIIENDPAKVVPRFQRKVDRAHLLYRLHESAIEKQKTAGLTELKNMETICYTEMETLLSNDTTLDLSEMDDLLKDAVETEVKFLR
nr:PREDICTED: secernin-2 [Bemisia tabaci]